MTSGTMDLRNTDIESVRGEGDGGLVQEWRPQQELYVKRRMGWVRVEGEMDERHEL